jgi:hypothetical protein
MRFSDVVGEISEECRAEDLQRRAARHCTTEKDKVNQDFLAFIERK